MISVRQALDLIIDLAHKTEIEHIDMADAVNRILAEQITAVRDQPPFTASAMDGYAIIEADLNTRREFTIINRIRAGDALSQRTIKSGETVQIFTGAPMPPGSDYVVIQEDVISEGNRIRLNSNIETSCYVRSSGSDYKKGYQVTAPRRLSPTDLSIIASMNFGMIPVRRCPIISIIPTGDELNMPGELLCDNKIVASNVFGLKGLLEREGCKVNITPIARDTEADLTRAMNQTAESDLVITVGGASVGEYDLVKSVAEDCGFKLVFHKIAMRPGKPLMAGKSGKRLFIGLPGNPVSALVCGVVFLIPAVRSLLGMNNLELPRLQVPLVNSLNENGKREHYMRAKTMNSNGSMSVSIHKRQDSSLLSVLMEANSLVIRQANDPARKAGEYVDYISLEGVL